MSKDLIIARNFVRGSIGPPTYGEDGGIFPIKDVEEN